MVVEARATFKGRPEPSYSYQFTRSMEGIADGPASSSTSALTSTPSLIHS